MEKQIVRPFLPQDPLLAKKVTAEVLVGEKVIQLFTEASFLQEWDELYASCRWSTVFQSQAFVTTWYAIYRREYLPVLVRSVSAGRLEGLLFLAQEKSGLLVGAGGDQAEYQVWLCREDDKGTFIQNALIRIRQVFPGNKIKLKYIPGKVPMDWVEDQKNWNSRCLIRKHKHPLLEAKEEAIHKELQKKNRREKMNRLKRMGELTFEKIIDEKVFASIFDDLAYQFDFRKGAMFNKTPIYSDPHRKAFYLALFNKGLLHATVLKLNKEIIASNIGTKGKRWVHLQGMNTHAPHYAKYSPGILHFLLLGKWLAAEGYEIFDLSPGGDSYKESLATKYTYAYEFSYTSLLSCQAAKFKHRLKTNLKDLTSQVGIKPSSLKKVKRGFALQIEKMKMVSREGWIKWGRQVWQQNRLQKKETLLRVELTGISKEGEKHISLRKGSLQDLLQYDQKGEVMTRWQFLKVAMSRLEAEYQPFTISAEGCLLACIWFKPPGLTQGEEGSIILEGAYCHQSYIASWDHFVDAVAREVSLNHGAAKVFLTIKGKGSIATKNKTV